MVRGIVLENSLRASARLFLGTLGENVPAIVATKTHHVIAVRGEKPGAEELGIVPGSW